MLTMVKVVKPYIMKALWLTVHITRHGCLMMLTVCRMYSKSVIY
jgi:hypothetical protein